MSRDIYDQFRAAQEQLVIKEAERLKSMQEAGEQLAARKAAKEAEIARAAAEKTRIREAKIAAQREELQPAAQQLQDILEAIRENDPRIQAARLKDVGTATSVEREYTDPRFLYLLSLSWGNKFGLTPYEGYQLEHPKRGLIARYLGEETPDLLVDEDFHEVTVALDIDSIGVHYGLGSRSLKTEDFSADNSLIFPLLTSAIANPIRRYLAHERITDKSVGIHCYVITDGRYRWDTTSVDKYGRREFENESPPGSSDSW